MGTFTKMGHIYSTYLRLLASLKESIEDKLKYVLFDYINNKI